jgi:tRNA (mo5U34)-methyltransferase
MRSSPPAGFDVQSFFEGTYWHQGWEIFPGIRIPGPSPVEYIMERVGFPRNIAGKRVLDVGAWNGCSSFECERRGAGEVVALSLEDPTAIGFNKVKGGCRASLQAPTVR